MGPEVQGFRRRGPGGPYGRPVTAVTRAEAAASRDALDIGPLMMASRAFVAAAVRALASIDSSVSVTQMRVLVLLWTGEPLNLTAVAEGLGVNPSNASRTCDRLVAAELVDRADDPADRRHVVLTLTERGRGFVELLMERREQELAAITARMSVADRERLMAALQPFNAAAESDLWPTDRPPGPRDLRLLEWGI